MYIQMESTFWKAIYSFFYNNKNQATFLLSLACLEAILLIEKAKLASFFFTVRWACFIIQKMLIIKREESTWSLADEEKKEEELWA